MKKLSLIITFLIAFNFSYSQQAWQFAIQTWTFHKYTFLESIEKADSLGIKNLEVYPGQKVGGGIPGTFSYSLDKDAREKLKQWLRYRKMKVIGLGVVDKDYYNKDNLEKFFEFASYMGIPYITAEPEWKDLDEFDRLAAKYRIKVAIHCHPRPSSHYWQPDSIVAAMKGRKNIGAWPDIGHWTRSGVDIVPALKKMEGKLWGLHFKDVKEFNNPKGIDTIFGKGVSGLPAVMKELKRQKFKGFAVLEYEANEDNNMGDMRLNILYYNAEIKKF